MKEIKIKPNTPVKKLLELTQEMQQECVKRRDIWNFKEWHDLEQNIKYLLNFYE
jgi:hypothetical protein